LTLARSYHKLKRGEDALLHSRRTLQRNPQKARTYHVVGLLLFDLSQVDEAIACFRRAIQIKPDFAKALNKLGQALCVN
jgi:protein O-GlcNAc transferase